MSQKVDKICIAKKTFFYIIFVLLTVILIGLSSTILKSKQIVANHAESIIGGQDVRLGEFSYVALLSNGCTGVLVYPRWVLTAAHCVSSNLSVAVGIIHKSDFNSKKNKVNFSIIHPDYDSSTASNDLALLLLEREEAEIFLPKLPQVNSDTFMYRDKTEVVSVGWGCIGISPTPGETITPFKFSPNWKMVFPEILQQTTFQIDLLGNVDGRENEFAYKDKEGKLLTHATCLGDSGGPILYVRRDKNAEIKDIYLIGIQKEGSSGLFQVLSRGTKIINFTKWINQTVSKLAPEPCSNWKKCRGVGFQCQPVKNNRGYGGICVVLNNN